MSTNTNQSGIYVITNTVNGKVYVGSSVNIAKRWSGHRVSLRQGTHKCRHLQAAWDHDGEGAFEFSILMLYPADDLVWREQEQIDLCHATEREFGYNSAPVAGTNRNCKRTPAMNEANRRRRIGARHRPESIEKIRAANVGRNNRMYGRRGELSPCFGKPCSAETREKIGRAHKGKTISAEQRAKQATYRGERHPQYGRRGPLCPNFGRVLTEEHKEKIRAGMKAAMARKWRRDVGHS